MSFKILFSKNPSEDYKTMDDEHHHQEASASSSIGGIVGDLPTMMMTSSEVAAAPPPPPPYEEQAPSFMSKPSTSSMVIVNNGMANNSGSLGSSSVSLPGQLSPASSTSQVADELNALQRAQLHLYKRLQQVKTQTYASLVVVLLLAGVILLFIANYHQANSQQGVSLNHQLNHQGASSELKALVSNVASNDPESNKRIGKALSASLAHISSSLAQGNSVDENLVKNTIDKHLTQLFQDQQHHHDHNLDPNQAFRTAALESGVVNSIAAAVQQAGQHHDDETILTELKAKQLAEIDGATVDTTEATTVMAITTTGATISTLNHNHQTFNISIVVHSATVPSMDYMLMGRASDTFCEVFIDDVLVGSTSVIDNSNNPNWQYLFPKPFTVRRESTIRIDLQDMDHLKRDHIGGVLVVFGDLLNTDRLNKPIKLFHGKGDIWVTIKLA